VAGLGGATLKIYVAGPYCPNGCSPHEAIRKAQENVNTAIDVGIALMDMGHIVFIPHLSHYIHQRMTTDWGKDFWYKFDLEWLRCCDAIFMLPGWETSTGAKLELLKAKEWSLNILYNLADIPSVEAA
jgi:hypothetical protein